VVTTIITGVVCAIFSAMLTFIVTNYISGNVYRDMVYSALLNHEKQMHQETVRSLLKEHENNCNARKDLSSIKNALVFLVAKQPNGNPKELGLMD